jgi:hypothetical protein
MGNLHRRPPLIVAQRTELQAGAEYIHPDTSANAALHCHIFGPPISCSQATAEDILPAQCLPYRAQEDHISCPSDLSLLWSNMISADEAEGSGVRHITL